MEESSEKRRERLRAMREEATLASNDEEGGAPVATPPDAPGLPPLTNLQQAPPYTPSPRFEFYTDPLAAFSGSQKKKKTRSSSGSPFGGAPASPGRPAPCHSPHSPVWQPKFANLNPSLPPAGSFSTPRLPNPNPNPNTTPNSRSNPNLPPPGSFSTPGPCSPNPHHAGILGQYYPGSFNTPGACFPNPNSNPNNNSNPYPNSNPNFHQPSTHGKFHHNSTPAGSFSTPSPSDYNPNLSPLGGHSNPGHSAYRPWSAFGIQQPSSAPHNFNGGGSGGSSVNSPAPYQYNGGRGNFSMESPPHRRAGGMNDVQSQGGNRSWGSFNQSPGSGSRGSRTPGRSGGRGFQRSHNHGTTSALTNPKLFAKGSMLLDPWKDLVPVRIESVAFRLNSCSAASSRDWLPRSVSSKGMTSPNTKQISVSMSGPSLAESLEASFADAVSGEKGT